MKVSSFKRGGIKIIKYEVKKIFYYHKQTFKPYWKEFDNYRTVDEKYL